MLRLPGWGVWLVADEEAFALELDDVSFLQRCQTRVSYHFTLFLLNFCTCCRGYIRILVFCTFHAFSFPDPIKPHLFVNSATVGVSCLLTYVTAIVSGRSCERSTLLLNVIFY